MNLNDVFEQLQAGELQMLSIGGEDQGDLNEQNYHKIVPHVNLGLNALYTKFSLRNGREKYFISHTNPEVHVENADLIKIEKVSLDQGVELAVNLEGDPYQVRMVNGRTLVVPEAIQKRDPQLPLELRSEQLTVDMKLNHPKIEWYEGANPQSFELQLPDPYLPALLFFIASRIHTPIGMTNEGNLTNIWYSKYLSECQLLEGKGIQIDYGMINNRLIRGGWV